MNAVPDAFISLEEYFALEETSEERHEYYHGAIFAMTGGTENHSLIILDTATALNNQLKGKICRPYMGDFRLKVEAYGVYTYPDISVICGETQYADGRRDQFLNPTVLIEVLSDSTKSYDRGEKAEFYRSIPSLQEYLLIAQDRPHVERYRRQGRDWLLSEFAALDDRVVLASIGCVLTLAELYARVQFPHA